MYVMGITFGESLIVSEVPTTFQDYTQTCSLEDTE